MLHLRHRSVRTALVATALSSSLAIGIVGGVVPAAAATPDPAERTPRTADVSKTVAPERLVKAPEARTTRALDTLRYRLQVVRLLRGFAEANGQIERSETGASVRGTFREFGTGLATVHFEVTKDDGLPAGGPTATVNNGQEPTQFTVPFKIKSVTIELCKVFDPAKPQDRTCQTKTYP